MISAFSLASAIAALIAVLRSLDVSLIEKKSPDTSVAPAFKPSSITLLTTENSLTVTESVLDTR